VDFRFSEEQLLFRDSLRDVLSKEAAPERIRELWDSDTGRDPALWRQLGELGFIGVLAPEAAGGLGLGETDFVLLAETCGYAALPEPLVETALAAIPMLAELGGDAAAAHLPGLVAGESRIALGSPFEPFVADAHVADFLLLPAAEEVHGLSGAEQAALVHQQSLDPSRRIYRLNWKPEDGTRLAGQEQGKALWARALNRMSLGVAAQLLGATQHMLDLSVQYTSERRQFGVPVGSFQAVKHLLANVAVQLEFARPVVYRAAWELASGGPLAQLSVSHARIAAGEAALLAAKNCIQAHGAMGYTWEVDLHIWMKRAWALDRAWGDRIFHRGRVADAVLEKPGAIGPGETFPPLA